jgi:hypothetical protein
MRQTYTAECAASPNPRRPSIVSSTYDPSAQQKQVSALRAAKIKGNLANSQKCAQTRAMTTVEARAARTCAISLVVLAFCFHREGEQRQTPHTEPRQRDHTWMPGKGGVVLVAAVEPNRPPKGPSRCDLPPVAPTVALHSTRCAS